MRHILNDEFLGYGDLPTLSNHLRYRAAEQVLHQYYYAICRAQHAIDIMNITV
jgi:hypothetical protein